MAFKGLLGEQAVGADPFILFMPTFGKGGPWAEKERSEVRTYPEPAAVCTPSLSPIELGC